jgi:hypothetical protein
MTLRSTLRPVAVLVAAGLFLAALVGIASAATKHGVTPVSPKKGATVPQGKSPTFKLRAKGGGVVYIHVCKSAKRDKKGVICHKEEIDQAHKHGGLYTVKPKFYDFPGFWMVSPGTYYWQAYRIKCEGGNISDCLQEGPVTKFKVG